MKSKYELFSGEDEYPLEDDYGEDDIPEIDHPSNSYYMDNFSDEYPD